MIIHRYEHLESGGGLIGDPPLGVVGFRVSRQGLFRYGYRRVDGTCDRPPLVPAALYG